MKVQELINELKKYPKNMSVRMTDLYEVEKVNYTPFCYGCVVISNDDEKPT